MRKLLGDLTVAEYVKLKIAEFKDEVDSWEVAQSIKEMTPSRCQVDEDGRYVPYSQKRFFLHTHSAFLLKIPQKRSLYE